MNEINIKKKIGARMRQLRLEIGLTQEELANKLVSVKGKSSIANYENGSNLPSDEVKFKMCELFNCSLDYLMCKSDIRNPQKIQLDDMDIAFASGIKGLNKENQETLKNIMDGLLAKQELEDKDKKE